MAERSIEAAGLTIDLQRTGDLEVIALSGELSLTTADALDREIVRLLASGVAEIVLDLRNLEFIDSTGARTIYVLAGRLREGDRLRIIPGPPQVQRAFEHLGLERAFPFVDS